MHIFFEPRANLGGFEPDTLTASASIYVVKARTFDRPTRPRS